MRLANLKNNVLFVNITSQGLVQIAYYLIPLLLIPYVTRMLGPESFGAACYAQNIAAYLTLLVNYGFEYTATQEIAIHKDDEVERRRIFWTVIRFKALLLLLSFVILAVLCFVSEPVHADPVAFLLSALINVGFVLYPTWFFQGMEKMAKMSVFSLVIKIAGAVLTVLLVSSPRDYYLYLFSLSAAQIAVGLYCFFYIARRYNMFADTAPQPFLKSPAVTKGFPVFVNFSLNNCNFVLGVTFIGYFLSNVEVGIYSVGQRLIMAVMMITCQPVTLSLFPRISRKFSESRALGLSYLRRCLLLVVLFGAVVSFATWLLSPPVIGLLFGSKYEAVIPCMRELSVLPLLVVVSSTLTVQGVYGMQLQKYSPAVGVLVFVCCLSLNYLLVPKYGVNGAACAWICCQMVEIVCDVALLAFFAGKTHRGGGNEKK